MIFEIASKPLNGYTFVGVEQHVLVRRIFLDAHFEPDRAGLRHVQIGLGTVEVITALAVASPDPARATGPWLQRTRWFESEVEREC